MHGKRMTTPRGTETLEFPRILIGLRKNARREAHVFPGRTLGASFSSATGSCVCLPAGIYLPARRRRSILVACIAGVQGWATGRGRASVGYFSSGCET